MDVKRVYWKAKQDYLAGLRGPEREDSMPQAHLAALREIASLAWNEGYQSSAMDAKRLSYEDESVDPYNA